MTPRFLKKIFPPKFRRFFIGFWSAVAKIKRESKPPTKFISLCSFKSVICSCSFCLFTFPAFAQFYSTQYRAPDQNWMEIRTDRFRLIYPQRYQNEAIRSLSILESEIEDIQALVGGRLHRFPFILNPENDLSNGFVAPFNFRSEVELAPIKGKTLNPRSGDWLESVFPHELVHALHFSVNPRLSFSRVLGLFSPDLRRSIHAAAPLGVLEGIAVHHESHGTVPYSGRGNYPFFNHQFNALLDSGDAWSMGQLVHTSDFTLPFNRHYVGGYELTHWLLHAYGEETVKRAIAFHHRFPFLGYGMALRHATGHWPGTLYRQFTENRIQREALRSNLIRENTDSRSKEIPFPATCKRMHRPLWIDENSILFYARSCNRPTGFYLHRTGNEVANLLKEVVIVGDHQLSLSDDRNRLLYSRYHPSPIYDNLFQGDLHQLNLTTKQSERITKGKRLFSPEWVHEYEEDPRNDSGRATNGLDREKILALQTEAHQLNLVLVDAATGTAEREFLKPENATVVQVARNPVQRNQVAMIGKIRGVQAVWLEEIVYTNSTSLFNRPPDIVFRNGSIFDLSWHPGGKKSLFASDHTGTMNIYEYHVETARLYQITESLYNAFEASYSPGGTSIAYIRQVRNEQQLFTLDLDQALYREIHQDEWAHHDGMEDLFRMPLMNREEGVDTDNWEFKEYRTGLSWLIPRLWMPLAEREAGFDRLGVTIENTDLMGRHASSLELTNYADRFWYDLTYTYKGFYPGFRLNLFSEPTIFTFRTQQNDEEFEALFLQQARGASLKIPFRIRLESNARFSSLLLEPQYFISQIRFLDPFESSVAFSDFGTRHTLGFRSVLNLNLRQFSRDVQPNSGWVFFAEARYGLNRADIEIDTGDFTVSGVFARRQGFRAGATTFVAPLARWNQSLRLSVQAITQTDLPVFNIRSLFSDSFSDTPFPGINNAGIVNTRYTIPLTYPDDGGLLVPLYLSNIYLVLFTQTVADLNSTDLVEGSRSVFGAGIRSRFRLSNLAFDIGFTIGWEPTRNEVTYRVGSF